jgi:hypothetical protein
VGYSCGRKNTKDRPTLSPKGLGCWYDSFNINILNTNKGSATLKKHFNQYHS